MHCSVSPSALSKQWAGPMSYPIAHGSKHSEISMTPVPAECSFQCYYLKPMISMCPPRRDLSSGDVGSGSWTGKGPQLLPGEATPEPPDIDAAEDMPRSRMGPAGSGDSSSSARDQLLKMQAAFKSSVEKDVCCLREVLAQYKEHNERLEMQKKLLLNQVRRLACGLWDAAF